jgi:hypothetical protein
MLAKDKTEGKQHDLDPPGATPSQSSSSCTKISVLRVGFCIRHLFLLC